MRETCSGCSTLQTIVQIEPPNGAQPPALLCASCVEKIQAVSDYLRQNAEQREREKEQAVMRAQQLWEQDPVLLLIEVGGLLLKTHLQKY